MSIQIIADSCCDINKEILTDTNIKLVPLTLAVENHTIIDDKTFDQQQLLSEMKASQHPVHTACPSPEIFAELYRKSPINFVVTLSSHLSGSYNSAMAAKEMIANENNKNIVYVFDSKSAAAGETLVALKLHKFIESGLPFEEIIQKTEDFISSMNTFFVLESLENLIKAGRINKIVGHMAQTLQLCPLMAGDDGKVTLIEKVRGNQKAIKKLIEKIVNINLEQKKETLVITYCNCLERAEYIKEEVLKLCNYFKEVVLVPSAGVSTIYANTGGIIVAF